MSVDRMYYLFFALIHIGMGTTVTAYTPFLQSIGLTLGEIALVNAIFWAVVIAAELPTGMFADGRSRAYSLKLGALFHAIGAFAYLFAQNFWSAALGEALTAIGVAFISGAGTAWIADALNREGRETQLRLVYATESLIKSVLMLLGGFVGSFIALCSPHFIWFPFIVTGLLASLVAHRLMNVQGEPQLGRGFFQPLTDSFVQHRIHTSYRATFGSLQSFLGRIGFAVVPLVVCLFIAGAPNTPTTISLVWIACAAVLILGALALWFTRPKEG